MRKAMSTIAATFRGWRVPEDARPVGVGLFRRRAAPSELAQTFGYARAPAGPRCIRNRPIHCEVICDTRH
jgi:hypothetical protein